MRYRAFLSYSHADRRLARWIHKKLESYRPPKAIRGAADIGTNFSLRPIFRDRDELSSSADLSGAVADALRNSEWLIVVCSPSAAQSRWVNEEIRIFRELTRSDRILSVIVDGTPNSGDSNECFPPALITGIDGEAGSIEPVAADARPQGDGKRNAVLKLAAGMLGVGFDALRQRDQARRLRQLAAITTGSVFVMAITIVLAITATLARDEAEQRRAQAEDLIDFMLGDLQEHLRELGRLDLYQSIGDEAVKYFESLRDEDVDDLALGQRSRNLRQIGEVRQDMGDLDAALQAFEEANLISFRLADRNPEDMDIQIGLAQGLFYVGSVYYQRGFLGEAKLRFQHAIPVVEEVSRREPNNVRWLRELGYVYTNIGRILELEGDYPAALEMYRSVMSANERLVRLEPDEIEWTLEVAFAHNNIGKVQATIGQLEAAEENYRQDLLLKKQVLQANPRHNIRRSYVAVSEYFLGQLLSMRGKFAEAVTLLETAREEFDTLINADPDQVPWLRRLANIKRELGHVHARNGNLGVGRRLVDEAIELQNTILEIAGDNTNVSSELAWSLLRKVRLGALAGSTEGADLAFSDAQQRISELATQQPDNIEVKILQLHLLSIRWSLAAEAASSERNSILVGVLETIESGFSGTSDPRVLAMKANALDLLNRTSEAADIHRLLEESGFDVNYF